jgi:peptidyl-dipeptidase Dcp
LRELAYNGVDPPRRERRPHDNRAIARRILALRNEQARLHGYTNYADYALVDRMAGTPAAVAALLSQVWQPAKTKAAAELEAIARWPRRAATTSRSSRGTGATTPRRCARSRYDCDDAVLKPYFSLDRMLGAAFDCAAACSGISFVERPTSPPITRTCACSKSTTGTAARDLPVRQLRAADQARRRLDERVSLPVADRRRRHSDHRQQQQLREGAGRQSRRCCRPTDVRTLFHEFGHGLHGMLSQVSFERPVGHVRAARFRRAALASSTSTGPRSARC